jgi:hypothetical protein
MIVVFFLLIIRSKLKYLSIISIDFVIDHDLVMIDYQKNCNYLTDFDRF